MCKALLPSATKLQQGNVLHMSVILFMGGCLPQCLLGHTLRPVPPGQVHPLGKCRVMNDTKALCIETWCLF